MGRIGSIGILTAEAQRSPFTLAVTSLLHSSARLLATSVSLSSNFSLAAEGGPTAASTLRIGAPSHAGWWSFNRCAPPAGYGVTFGGQVMPPEV